MKSALLIAATALEVTNSIPSSHGLKFLHRLRMDASASTGDDAGVFHKPLNKLNYNAEGVPIFLSNIFTALDRGVRKGEGSEIKEICRISPIGDDMKERLASMTEHDYLDGTTLNNHELCYTMKRWFSNHGMHILKFHEKDVPFSYAAGVTSLSELTRENQNAVSLYNGVKTAFSKDHMNHSQKQKHKNDVELTPKSRFNILKRLLEVLNVIVSTPGTGWEQKEKDMFGKPYVDVTGTAYVSSAAQTLLSGTNAFNLFDAGPEISRRDIELYRQATQDYSTAAHDAKVVTINFMIGLRNRFLALLLEGFRDAEKFEVIDESLVIQNSQASPGSVLEIAQQESGSPSISPAASRPLFPVKLPASLDRAASAAAAASRVVSRRASSFSRVGRDSRRASAPAATSSPAQNVSDVVAAADDHTQITLLETAVTNQVNLYGIIESALDGFKTAVKRKSKDVSGRDEYEFKVRDLTDAEIADLVEKNNVHVSAESERGHYESALQIIRELVKKYDETFLVNRTTVKRTYAKLLFDDKTKHQIMKKLRESMELKKKNLAQEIMTSHALSMDKHHKMESLSKSLGNGYQEISQLYDSVRAVVVKYLDGDTK